MEEITSLESIIKERETWENLIEGSTKLLENINGIKADSKNELLKRYISVLWALKSVKEAKDEIERSVYNIANHVNISILQETIRKYISCLDSALDYLQRFVSEINKTQILPKLPFDRKDKDFSDRVNKIRNEILHECVPTLEIIKSSGENIRCPAYTNGIETDVVDVRIKYDHDGVCKWFSLCDFIKITYEPTQKEIQIITLEIVSAFK